MTDTHKTLDNVFRTILAPWLASYERLDLAGLTTNVPAISQGQPENPRIVDTGLEIIISKTPRMRMDFHLGKGQVESKKYSVLFILWQPHQPELQQLNLSPKITSFDADTGDGESILQKIFGLQRTQEWKNIRIVNTRADDRNTPASYQIEIEISPVYCVS